MTPTHKGIMMPCPKCGEKAEVVNTHTKANKNRLYIKRTRECPNGHKFHTIEYIVVDRKGRL